MLFRDTYGKQREKLSKECESLVNKAENHFQSNGRYTEAEQKLYEQAEQLCQQLMDLHDTGSAEYSSWQRSKNMYSAKVAEIERTLKGISAQSAVKSAGSSAKPAQPAANQAVPPVKPAQPAANEASVQQESVTAENRSKTETRTLTTTPSGFSTYNARDKLSASAIEQWFPKGKDIPTHGLDDLSGMDEVKAVFKKLIEATDWEKTYKALQYQNKFGFVLFGPPGSGKTHFIEAFVHEMINKGYTYMKLLGGDIRNSYVGETEKNIEALFNEAIDKSPCVIFIDEFEGVCRERTSGESKSYDQSATIAFLEGYNRLHSHMKNNGAPVLFFCATNHLNQLDEAMQSRLSKIYVPLPDEKARRNYFENKFKGIALAEGVSYEWMSGQTADYSYRNLNELNQDIRGALVDIAKNSVDSLRDLDAFRMENGEVDQKKLDDAASKNVYAGKIPLTLELFEKIRGALIV